MMALDCLWRFSLGHHFTYFWGAGGSSPSPTRIGAMAARGPRVSGLLNSSKLYVGSPVVSFGHFLVQQSKTSQGQNGTLM